MYRFLAFLALALIASPVFSGDWPLFRGARQSGQADQPAPSTWRVKDSPENVAWTAELPGRGPSSPIVVGGKVIVTASSGANQKRMHILAFDVATGKELWHRQFWATGRTLCHPQSANAAPTPASDGQRIFAFYSSNDLVCLDLDGNLLWYRGLNVDYPKAGNDVGMSSSPTVIDDTVVVQVECQGDSFAAGIDVETGENRWRIARPAAANWCSPVAVPGKNGQPNLLLLQSGEGLTAHDPRTGNELWRHKAECAGIPSAAVDGDKIYLPAGGITSLKFSGSSQPEFLWSSLKVNPGSASPVVRGDRVYAVNRSGVVNCGDTATGDLAWSLRLKGAYWATPVLAGDFLYLVNFDGEAQVVNVAGEKGELVASVEFGEPIQSSPAASNGALYFRGDKHLWKIAAPGK